MADDARKDQNSGYTPGGMYNGQSNNLATTGSNLLAVIDTDLKVGGKGEIALYNESCNMGQTYTADFNKWMRDHGQLGNFYTNSFVVELIVEHRSHSTRRDITSDFTKQDKKNKTGLANPEDVSSPNVYNAYTKIINAVNNNIMSVADGQKAVKEIQKATGDNGDGYLAMDMAQANTAYDLGIITHEQLERTADTFLSNDGSEIHEAAVRSKDSANTQNHPKLAKFRQTSWALTKFTAKSASKGIKISGKLAYRGGKMMIQAGMAAQFGSSSGNAVLDQASGSIGRISGKLARVGMKSINELIYVGKSYIKFRKETWNEKKDEKKLGKAQLKKEKAQASGKKGAKKRADKKIGKLKDKKQNSSHIASDQKHGFIKSIASAEGLRGGLAAGRGLVRSPVSVGKFATGQVSKMTTEAFGQSDETASRIWRTGKKTVKTMMRAPSKVYRTTKKTVKFTKKAVKTTKRIAQTVQKAAQTVAKVTVKVVQAVVHVVSSIINFLVSNPVGWGIIAIAAAVIIIMVLFGSCTDETGMIMEGTLGSMFQTREGIARQCANMYQDYTNYWYQGLGIYGTENGGSNAYTTYDNIFKLYDELQEYGLVEEDDREFSMWDYEAINTTWHKEFDPQWFNPYCLLAYLEVKYGEFNIGYMQAELDPENEDSIFWNQYTFTFRIEQSQSSLGVYDENGEQVSNPEDTYGMSMEYMIDTYTVSTETDENGNVSHTCTFPQLKAYTDDGEEYLENGKPLDKEQLENLFEQGLKNEDNTQATVDYQSEASTYSVTLFVKSVDVTVTTKPIDNYDIYVTADNNGFNNTAMQLLAKMDKEQNGDDDEDNPNDENKNYDTLNEDFLDNMSLQQQYQLKCYTYGQCNNFDGEHMDDEQKAEFDKNVEEGIMEKKFDPYDGAYYVYIDEDENTYTDVDGNEQSTYKDPITGEDIDYEQRYYVDNTKKNNNSDNSEDGEDDEDEDDESYGYWWPLVYEEGSGVNAGMYEYATHPETHGEKNTCPADDGAEVGDEITFDDFCRVNMDGFDIDNPNGNFTRQESTDTNPWNNNNSSGDYSVGSGAGFGVVGNFTVDNNSGFAWPMTDNFHVNSHYGWRAAIKTSGGYSSTQHFGIDIEAGDGTPIIAAYDGTIVDFAGASASDPYGYNGGRGWYVVLEHDYNGAKIYTLYQHMSAFVNVPRLDSNGNEVTDAFGQTIYEYKIGDKVKQGTVIGEVGQTGNVSGPHLHFEIHKSWPDSNTTTLYPLDFYPDLVNYGKVWGEIGNFM